SAFKIREGLTIGAKVTLRGARMYDFVEKLVNITQLFPGIFYKLSLSSCGHPRALKSYRQP
ncbi:MAG: hypothetical protein EOM74_02885, partial [Methanomicrobia archaeon]|nr:hypothetical protein [Methanomicrobia archaeon]